MSTSPLGLKNPLFPPINLGEKQMLKLRSPLVQASQLMLPQTIENSDNFFNFSQGFSPSDYAEKPTAITSQFVDDDFESDSSSIPQINHSITESQIQEKPPNNPLSELHPRLSKQLIQTQSRILTTTEDKQLTSQMSDTSDSQVVNISSDQLPVTQAKWENDSSQPISDSVDTASIQNQPIPDSIPSQIIENQEPTDTNINTPSPSQVQLHSESSLVKADPIDEQENISPDLTSPPVDNSNILDIFSQKNQDITSNLQLPAIQPQNTSEAEISETTTFPLQATEETQTLPFSPLESTVVQPENDYTEPIQPQEQTSELIETETSHFDLPASDSPQNPIQLSDESYQLETQKESSSVLPEKVQSEESILEPEAFSPQISNQPTSPQVTQSQPNPQTIETTLSIQLQAENQESQLPSPATEIPSTLPSVTDSLSSQPQPQQTLEPANEPKTDEPILQHQETSILQTSEETSATLNTPSLNNTEPQQVIQEQPVDLVQETSIIESSKTSSPIEIIDSSNTTEIQQSIQRKSIDSTQDTEITESADDFNKNINQSSSQEIESLQLRQEISIDSSQESSTVESLETALPIDNINSVQDNQTQEVNTSLPQQDDTQQFVQRHLIDLTPDTSIVPPSDNLIEETDISSPLEGESQLFIPENPIDSVQENVTVKSSELPLEIENIDSHNTAEIQQDIQRKTIESTLETERTESPNHFSENINQFSSQEIESLQLRQETPINSLPGTEKIQPSDNITEKTDILSPQQDESQPNIQQQSINLLPENLPSEVYIPSSKLSETQKLMPEESVNLVPENLQAKSFESLQDVTEVIKNPASKPIETQESKATDLSSDNQFNIIQSQVEFTENLSSLKSDELQTLDQEIIENQSSQIQARLSPENLTNTNLIQSHSPLTQASDFIQSQLINEWIEQSSPSETVSETPSISISNLISKVPEKSQISPKSKEDWSDQFNLMSESIPATDNIQESWSSFTELLDYDNFNSSSNSALAVDTPQSITIEQIPPIPDSPVSVSSSPTKIEKVTGEQGESLLIDEEQLEMLARKVYNLLRQQLELERERHHFKIDGTLPWLDTISQTVPAKASGFSSNLSPPGQLQTQTGSTISPVDYKLQTLTQKVYQELRLKIEIERERLGFYYRGKFP